MSRSRHNFRDRSMESWSARSELRGHTASIGNDFTNGHRGHARAVRGAKKRVRTSVRRDNKRIATQWRDEMSDAD